MGGLVARRYILDGNHNVGRMVTLGTPWLGAPKSIPAFETGRFDGVNLLISPLVLSEIAPFIKGAQELIPSRAYTDDLTTNDLGSFPTTKNNLSKILENVEAATGGADTGTKPADKPKTEPANKGASKKLQVDDFLLSGAKVNVNMPMLGGKSLTVVIPDIHFTALGTGPEGITAGELTKKVLSQITSETRKAVEKAVADLGKQATEALKGAAGEEANKALDKAAKSVGDLFKKKK